jgi:pimeloyl-ACP methyl ester carboxylesterase
VFLLGHSYGGVCALEAAFLTDKISELVLYEPPLQERNRSAVAAKMESMVRAGQREQALITFLQDIVMIAPRELEVMRARPSWPSLVAGIESQIRQIQALDAYRFDAKRLSALKIPTLLLTDSKTASPDLKRAIDVLMTALPNRSLFIFEGQEHNAMDTVRRQFAEAVTKFLLDTKSKAD